MFDPGRPWTGKALAVVDAKENGARSLEDGAKGEAPLEQWYFEYVGEEHYYIRNRWSTKCLQLGEGDKICQGTPNGDRSQQWKLVPGE